MMWSHWRITSTNSSLLLHTLTLKWCPTVASIVFTEKLVINLIGVLLYWICHFSLTALKIFSLSLTFDILAMICLGMDLSVFILLGVWKHNGWKLPNLMKNILHGQEAQRYFFNPFLCLLLLWCPFYTYIGI